MPSMELHGIQTLFPRMLLQHSKGAYLVSGCSQQCCFENCSMCKEEVVVKAYVWMCRGELVRLAWTQGVAWHPGVDQLLLPQHLLSGIPQILGLPAGMDRSCKMGPAGAAMQPCRGSCAKYLRNRLQPMGFLLAEQSQPIEWCEF